VIFKLINRRWWVKLDPDVTALVRQLDRLRWLKKDQQPTEEEQLMQDVAAQNVPPTSAAEISENPRGERLLVGNSEISMVS
jgi:hypothetical protein